MSGVDRSQRLDLGSAAQVIRGRGETQLRPRQCPRRFPGILWRWAIGPSQVSAIKGLISNKVIFLSTGRTGLARPHMNRSNCATVSDETVATGLRQAACNG
jgi:hypothetical protein